MSEWIELNSIEDVARAKVEGWEIEVKDIDGDWIPWRGSGWHAGNSYRGRPKQQPVIYECYDVGGRLEWWHQDRHAQKPWTRIPQFDKTVEAAK